MSIKEKFVNSSKELKNVYSLAALAMLLAVRVVVGILPNITLPLTGNMFKYGINFLPIAVAAIMFGPVGASIVGGIGEVLAFIIVPAGIFNPGITFNECMIGLLFGIFLYKNNAKLINVIISWSIIAVVFELFLKTIWLYIFTFQFSMLREIFLARMIGEAITFVPAVLLIFSFGKAVGKIKIK